mmetsp:Transcript_25665/g.45566  ORF Transcript_25665/g.45566 Transcript_25665/m.45566 type:complete len:224 (+) Transcript_25665:1142-1813(+)
MARFVLHLDMQRPKPLFGGNREEALDDSNANGPFFVDIFDIIMMIWIRRSLHLSSFRTIHFLVIRAQFLSLFEYHRAAAGLGIIIIAGLGIIVDVALILSTWTVVVPPLPVEQDQVRVRDPARPVELRGQCPERFVNPVRCLAFRTTFVAAVDERQQRTRSLRLTYAQLPQFVIEPLEPLLTTVHEPAKRAVRHTHARQGSGQVHEDTAVLRSRFVGPDWGRG